MLTIPELALPVVEILRRDVKRPRALPIVDRGSTNTPPGFPRWHFKDRRIPKCPMGLHPLALSPTPTNKKNFPVKGCATANIRAFFRWWDDQTKPKEAREAVWPGGE